MKKTETTEKTDKAHNAPAPTKQKKHKASAKQLRFLSQSAILEESASPHVISATVGLVCLILCVFLGWAAVTHLNEVAHAEGEVIPAGYLQAVQHSEGGIVSDIAVEEGDFVQEGQLLARLDEHNLRSDYARNAIRQRSLALKAARLRAFIEDKEPDFSQFSNDFSHLADEEKELLLSMQFARQKKRNLLDDQIDKTKREIATLTDDITSARQNVSLLEEENRIRQDLVKRGISSKIISLESRRRLNEAKSSLQNLRNQHKTAKAGFKEAQTRLESLDADLRETALTELKTVETERAELDEVGDKFSVNLDRMDIRAPTSGLVQEMKINTIGGVIAPGETLMEIVPIREEMVVESKISPRDVGHIDIGQTVKVKVSAYDYARYGAVSGKITSLSPATYSNEQGDVYYKGRIILAQGYVGNNPNRNLILPGMTVQADIVTGRKTVLQYLLKPIHLAMSNAFTER